MYLRMRRTDRARLARQGATCSTAKTRFTDDVVPDVRTVSAYWTVSGLISVAPHMRW